MSQVKIVWALIGAYLLAYVALFAFVLIPAGHRYARWRQDCAAIGGTEITIHDERVCATAVNTVYIP